MTKPSTREEFRLAALWLAQRATQVGKKLPHEVGLPTAGKKGADLLDVGKRPCRTPAKGGVICRPLANRAGVFCQGLAETDGNGQALAKGGAA